MSFISHAQCKVIFEFEEVKAIIFLKPSQTNQEKMALGIRRLQKKIDLQRNNLNFYWIKNVNLINKSRS